MFNKLKLFRKSHAEPDDCVIRDYDYDALIRKYNPQLPPKPWRFEQVPNDTLIGLCRFHLQEALTSPVIDQARHVEDNGRIIYGDNVVGIVAYALDTVGAEWFYDMFYEYIIKYTNKGLDIKSINLAMLLLEYTSQQSVLIDFKKQTSNDNKG